MLDQNLRVYKEQLLTPVADRVHRGVHPTMITAVAAVFGGMAALAGWQQLYWLGLLFWVMNRVLDGLDGTLARRTNQQSDFGGYIDILADDLIYSIVVLFLAIGVNTTEAYIAAGFLLVTYRVNAASWMYLASLMEKRALGAKTRGEMTSITMPSGLIEGTETVVFYIAFFVFPSLLVPLFWVFGTLVMLTVGQRILWAARNLDN